MAASGDRLVVLLYHAIWLDQDQRARLEASDKPYSISADLFCRHLDALHGAGYVICGDFDQAFQVPGKRVVITFDDSLPTHTLAADILARRGERALFLLCTDEIGMPGRLDLKGVAHLVHKGMGLGSHGATHRFFTQLPPTQLRTSLEASINALQKWGENLGVVVSCPGGRYNETVKKAVRMSGFTRMLTSDNIVNDAAVRPFVIGRCNITAEITPEKLLKLVARERNSVCGRLSRRMKMLGQKLLGERAYMGLWSFWHRLNRQK